MNASAAGRFRYRVVFALPLVIALVAGCSLRRAGSSGRSVQITYDVRPDHPEIFASATETAPLRVCVLKVDVSWGAGGDDGGQAIVWEYRYNDGSGEVKTASLVFGPARTHSPTSGRLWENAIRSQLGALLHEQARAAGKSIQLVSRDELDEYLREKDLTLADIVERGQLSDETRLLGIDLYVLGSISGQTVVHTRTKSNPVRWFASAVPYVGGAIREISRPKQEVTRTITIAGSLKAQDARTGKVWLTHDISQQRVNDKKPRLWEGDVRPEDLMPEEQQIRELLDPEVRRFVGRMLPTPQYAAHAVRPSRDRNSKLGVVHLELKEDEHALAAFQEALAEHPQDHRSAFGAGIACERLGRLGEAKEYYHQACLAGSGKDEPRGQYQVAYERVQWRIDNDAPLGSAVRSASVDQHETPRADLR